MNKIARIKKTSLDLVQSGQLPKALVLAIQKITNNDENSYINSLKDLSEHYLRVKGYYKKYPDIHKEVNSIIEKTINELRKGGLDGFITQ